MRTATGQLERGAVSNVTVRLPGQISVLADFSATDLSFAEKMASRPISLILGKEYFDNLEFLVTPGLQEIQLGPSASLSSAGRPASVVMKNDRPQIDVMIDGQPALLTIDLGYEGEIALNERTWVRLGLNGRPSSSGRSAHLDGRIEPTIMTKVDNVVLGTVAMKDVHVTSQQTFDSDGDGFIGFGLLSRWNFAIDVKARRLWLISPVRSKS